MSLLSLSHSLPQMNGADERCSLAVHCFSTLLEPGILYVLVKP